MSTAPGAGAKAIGSKQLARIEVRHIACERSARQACRAKFNLTRSSVPVQCHGKNLFYFFGTGEDTVVMHVHFGMSGAFRTSLPGQEPEARETTRLKLVAPDVVAQLSAMTVAHGGLGASLLSPGARCPLASRV